MNSRRMGRTGLRASEVSRGTTSSGFQIEESEASRLPAGGVKPHAPARLCAVAYPHAMLA